MNNPLADFDFKELKNPNFKEDSVREVIIMPILNALGFDDKKNNPYKIHRSVKLNNNWVKYGSKSKELNPIFPDYILSRNGKYFFVLEAKDSSKTINGGDAIHQAFSYAIHPEINCQLFGLCNGHSLTIFNDRRELLLDANLQHIENYWDDLTQYIAPTTDQVTQINILANLEKDYTKKLVPPNYITVRKRAVKRHFGVHGYFTKQSWNVVQEYIKQFSEPNDLIVDPFGGSGVSAIEAMMLDRRAIHVDLNPLSTFMVESLTKPVDLQKLQKELVKISNSFSTYFASSPSMTPPPVT